MKKKFAKRQKKSARRFLLFLFAALLIVVGGSGTILATYDINKNRDDIADALSKWAGRQIAIKGPITWHVALLEGVSLSVSDVTVANPSWASRPFMARIGRAELQIDILKALAKKIDVKSFTLTDADIQLERSAKGKENWQFDSAESPAKAAAPSGKDGKKSFKTAFSIRKVQILGSRIGVRSDKGDVTVLTIPRLILTGDARSLRIHYKGAMGVVPLEIDLAGGPLEAISGAQWPFNVQALIGDARVKASGSLKDHIGKIEIGQFKMTSGESDLHGVLSVALDRERPFFRGDIKGTFFDIDALTYTPPETKGIVGYVKNAVASATPKEGPLFSRDPLPFETLKTFDAYLSLSLGTFQGIIFPLQDLKAKMVVDNGHMTLSPLTAKLAGSQVKGHLDVDASDRQPKGMLLLQGRNLEFSKLVNIGGFGTILSGKVDLMADITAAGRSPYELVSNAHGTLELLMDAGKLSSNRLKEMAGGMIDLLFPGARLMVSPGVNCMAARYNIKSGYMQTKGFLLDSDATTVAGYGGINLPEERMSMTFRTRPKGVSAAAMLPSMKLYGPLLAPKVTFDTESVVQSVKGLLLKGQNGDVGVPDMLHLEGQNDCAVTLDHPALSAPKTTTPTLLPEKEALKDSLKSMGGQLLDNLGRKFLGE